MSRISALFDSTLSFELDNAGERVGYTPTGGTIRQITAAFAPADQMTVDLLSDHTDDEEEKEVFNVSVRKSGSLGIDSPSIGDAILRDKKQQDDDRPFVFSGMIKSETKNRLVLVYWRYKQTARGG